MVRKTNVLVIYTAMIPTAKLVMDMMQIMEKTSCVNIKGKKSINIRGKDIRWADVLLFVRGADPYMEKISEAAYKSGRYCILYLDDDLLNVPSDGVETYKNALKRCLYWCNVLWSSNINILRKYEQYMQKAKCVNEKVFEPIDMLLPPKEETEKIRIVYAGSPSHAVNLQNYLIPALNHVCARHREVMVTFIGLRECDLKDVTFTCEYIPWFQDFQKYKDFIIKNRYHIGLAVIKDEEFYHCKFYNKFLEYGKMGVLGIYTDCDPYRFIVKDHENGLLSENISDEWEKNLEEAISDHKLRKRCIENAQKVIKEEFDINNVLHQLQKKIPEIIKYQAEKTCDITYQEETLYTRFFNFLGSTKAGYWLWERMLILWHSIQKNRM